MEQLVGNYKDWSLGVGKGSTQVAVIYSSDYGYSDRWVRIQVVSMLLWHLVVLLVCPPAVGNIAINYNNNNNPPGGGRRGTGGYS